MREGNTHRKPEVMFGIAPVPILWPLAVLASVQNDVSLFAWWDFLFLSPASARQESASLESPASWVGDSFCCCRLHSCPAWRDYWHLHVCGVAASHGLYWLRNTSYSFLFPARHSSSPMGPAPLAGTPKSSMDALADPFP